MPPARPDSPVGSVVERASRLVGPPRRAFSGSPVSPSNSAPNPAEPLSAPMTPESGSERLRTPRTLRGKAVLETLLADLGSQVQRGPSRELAESPRLLATGLVELDASLGGGFPCGRISEICGPPSSGRTALALRLVRRALGGKAEGSFDQGRAEGSATPFVGWIDLGDAFDPPSASACGIDLERLLWVRPRSCQEALRSCDRLLQTEGFDLVVFDAVLATCGGKSSRSGRGTPDSIRDVDWLRLARVAARTRSALVVLSPNLLGPATGSRAELVLELLPSRARFSARSGKRFTDSPDLLEAMQTTAILRRHRSRPDGAEVHLSLNAGPLQT